jgi:ribA/ribD-fused uncharacterized protein
MSDNLFSTSDEMYYEHPEFKTKTWKELCIGWNHDEYNIKGFFGQYRFLSNFYPCDITYDNFNYHSSENAYQASKVIRGDRTRFQCMSPDESKRHWKLFTPRYSSKKWDKEMKYHVMFSVLWHKFSQNEDLKLKLIDTGERYLEETNWWGDSYWGVCNGFGDNNLGKQLMTIREMLN